ncbi:hypothetical protein NHJ13734_001828 [Beauveria thailandica]
MSQRFDAPVWLPIVNLAPFWATRRLLAHVSHRGPSHVVDTSYPPSTAFISGYWLYLVPLTNPLWHLGSD